MKKYLIFLVLFLAFTLSQSQNLNDSLVFLYPFSGNTNDASGNGYHAQNYGASLVMDRFGNPNSAYQFDGINDYIELPSDTAIKPPLPISIAFWIKSNNVANYLKNYFLTNDDQYNMYSGIVVGVYPGTSQVSIGYGVNYGNTGYQYRRSKVSSATLSSGVWQHIICVFRGPTDMDIYINGINAGGSYSGAAPTGIGYSNNPGRVGKYAGNSSTGTLHYEGAIDDIILWRQALTPIEAIIVYNGCLTNNTIIPNNQQLLTGSQAIFSVMANNLVASYQWQTDLGLGFQNMSDTGQYSGTLTDSLIISGLSLNNDGQQFRCIIVSGLCNDTSSIATLNVCPAIDIQPSDQNASFGMNTHFYCLSTDTISSYQWQTDLGSGFVDLSNAGQYFGVDSDSLYISNLNASNHNQIFRCIISSGSCSDTSIVVSLTSCPDILNQPLSQSISITQAVQFVSTYSDPASTYQWQTDLGVGFINMTNAGQFTGAFNDTLNVANTNMVNNNQLFRCIMTSPACIDTSMTAVLMVINNVGINENYSQQIHIYPNPVSESLNIDIESDLVGSIYYLKDQFGRVIQQGTLELEHTVLDINSLSTGLYILQVNWNISRVFIKTI